MTSVHIEKSEYSDPHLREILFHMLEACAGTAVAPGARVLIKPNLLMPAKPAQAILTHPSVVRFTVEWVLEKGGRPLVADSPAIGSFDKILKNGGYAYALSGLTVPCRPFRESTLVNIGKPFHRIELAKEAIEADMVINLAKLKTHTHMLMTLGVKNMFGCVVALKKPEWHLRSGVDRDLFARLLVQIHRSIAPSVTLVDGILGLQGQGPGKSGNPRHLGILIGSTSAPAADATICRMLGFSPDRLPTHRAAESLGVLPGDISVMGDPDPIIGFDLPTLSRLTFGPKPLQGLIRKHLTQRPMVRNGRCVRCGECVSYCPAEAVTMGDPTVIFDYDRCIRCYCCVELCPHGALHAADTRPGRIMKRLSRVLSQREI